MSDNEAHSMDVNGAGVVAIRGRRGFGSVLTIDGATGSGKSLLLSKLSAHYGCEVIELGLVVRAIAWWATQRGTTASNAVASLAGLGRLGGFALIGSPDSPLAACDVFVHGESQLVEILDPQLAPAVSAISLDSDAMAWVHAFVRELARDGVAAISGRHASTATCPDAGLKIRLEADWPTRQARKVSQRSGYGLDFAVVDDADLLSVGGADQLKIDTTHLTPAQLFLFVSQLVERQLGWRPRRGILTRQPHLRVGAA